MAKSPASRTITSRQMRKSLPSELANTITGLPAGRADCLVVDRYAVEKGKLHVFILRF
jgi:hypothetical protein